MSSSQSITASITVIHDGTGSTDGSPITGEIDRTSDPGNPCVRLEAGCNEFWLNVDEALAVRDYLTRIIPSLQRGGEDG